MRHTSYHRWVHRFTARDSNGTCARDAARGTRCNVAEKHSQTQNITLSHAMEFCCVLDRFHVAHHRFLLTELRERHTVAGQNTSRPRCGPNGGISHVSSTNRPTHTHSDLMPTTCLVGGVSLQTHALSTQCTPRLPELQYYPHIVSEDSRNENSLESKSHGETDDTCVWFANKNADTTECS